MMDNIKENCIIASAEPISLEQNEKIIEQMKNSICRINDQGTGFFVKIPFKSKILPVLITTNHIINADDIINQKNISLYLNNDKNLKAIKLDNNRLTYTNEKINISIIEIKENEDNLNIKYLELDDEIIKYFKKDKKVYKNYLDNIYNNESIYLLDYSKEKEKFVSYGKLLDINNKEIFHNCNIKQGSSGSPILLINNQKLIGIHYGSSNHYKYNIGKLLIYSIIESSKIKNNSLIVYKDHIIGELDIKEDEQNIRIINSYEQANREKQFDNYKKKNENEKEIIENCEIIINGDLIPFSYFHKFNKKGKYTIIYYFKKKISKTNLMFFGCSSLTNIDLTNFNTNNVKDMSYMFSGCSSLININLLSFNTNNVIDMSYMFNECSSLTNIDLSNFNTNNVNDMSYMFNRCSSLTNIDLFIFNTNKVTNMNHMFSECSSLTNIDLSNFNTNNVKDMSNMFHKCSSLNNINVTNFNTNNVTDMNSMFSGCSSLTNIDLSNFNTNNVDDISGMFYGCSSLTNINLSNFNTNNIVDMSWMFCGCSSLTNIDLSNFKTDSDTDMKGMFEDCKLLTKNNIISKNKRILNKFKH